MATTMTSIGPVGARQINRNFFVGQSDLTTIQRAVTIAVTSGGGCVIIPAGYLGADAIASVTGGNAAVYISDQRQGAGQGWRWSGTAFVPADFDQLSGFISRGIPQPAAATMQMGFDPAGTSGIEGNTGTGYLLATANAGTGVPSFQLQSQRSDGGQLYTFMRCDLDRVGDFRIQMPQVLELNNDATNLNLWVGQSRDTDSSQGFYIWAQPSLSLIDLQSETVNHPFRPAIALNRLGGDVEIALLGTTTAGNINAQNLTIDGDIVTQTCEVDGSPVRTFANTGDAPAGMIWPPIGIAVSAGSAWGTAINPATLATYPPAGVPVSTGAAWGTPIPIADIARLSLANIFTATPQSVTHGGAVMSVYGNEGAVDLTTFGFKTVWNLQQSNGRTGFVNIGSLVGSGGFDFYNTWVGAASFDKTQPIMQLNSTGNLTVAGTSTFGGSATASLFTLASSLLRILPRGTGNTGSANINADAQTLALNPGSAGVVWLSCDQGGGTRFGNAAGGYVGSVDTTGNATFNGTVSCANGRIRLFDRAAGILTGSPSISSDNNVLILNPSATSAIYLTWDQGSGGTVFGNGAAAIVGSVDHLGKATFSALAVSGAKTFVIEHPMDKTKDLVHACLEGPENGIYYRGEGATAGGWAEIILPYYFEALAKPDQRTVQLTPLFEDDDEPISALAASRVKNGKFRVWSGAVTQKFYWEVKAVRGDIEPLDVTPPRTETHSFAEPSIGEADDEARADRTGKNKDRKLHTAHSLHATTTPADAKRTRRVHPPVRSGSSRL